jgi:hypothetical protein
MSIAQTDLHHFLTVQDDKKCKNHRSGHTSLPQITHIASHLNDNEDPYNDFFHRQIMHRMNSNSPSGPTAIPGSTG